MPKYMVIDTGINARQGVVWAHTRLGAVNRVVRTMGWTDYKHFRRASRGMGGVTRKLTARDLLVQDEREDCSKTVETTPILEKATSMMRYLVTVKTRDGVAVFNRVMVDAPDSEAVGNIMDAMKIEAGLRSGMPDPLRYFKASYEEYRPGGETRELESA